MTIFFENINDDLDQIIKNNDFLKFRKWYQDTLLQVDGYYKLRLERIYTLIEKNYNDYNEHYKYHFPNDDDIYIIINTSHIKSILRDMWIKNNIKKHNTKENIELEKLLKARENDLDFDEKLTEIICGYNDKFPYRDSDKLTDFFNKLGYNLVCDPYQEKRFWMEEKLKEWSVKDIRKMLSSGNGLFNKKYFEEHIINNTILNVNLDLDNFYNEAKLEFKNFIKDSSEINPDFNLSNVLDLNLNIELLFDNKASTKDVELNSLIEEAKRRFLNDDKQIALEKLWDSFERLKTSFNSNKRISSKKVIDKISENFDKPFIEDEFKVLTNIGNNYRIRHHETGKNQLSNQHINYCFFRMLSLVDLYLIYFKEEEK